MADTVPAFTWKGIDKKGKRVQGTTKAASMTDAHSELRKQGIEIITIKPKATSTMTMTRAPKVKNKNILLFTRYLSTMLASGLPLLQALDIIGQDQENASMHAFVATLRSNVSSGKTLAETFKQFPQYFNELYVNLISAGERSGSLDKVLKRLGIYLERTETLHGKVKKAMIYPAAIVSVALIASSIMLILVVPKFAAMFKSFGATLPLFTRIVLSISNVMQHYWWLIVIIIMVGVYIFRYFMRTSLKFQRRVDQLVLRLFIIGPILKKGIIARFTRTLSTTLDAGMPITEALRSMSGVMGNTIYAEGIKKIGDDVTNGHQLNVSMSTSNLFPNMVIQMISVGEVSGNLGEMLTKIAEYYEEEVNNIVDNLSSLMEPLIMLVLGVVVGSLVIAMYLPIFKLGSLF
ncbi:MAG: type II secretion system F family protein [Pseudomonadota bacterium]